MAILSSRLEACRPSSCGIVLDSSNGGDGAREASSLTSLVCCMWMCFLIVRFFYVSDLFVVCLSVQFHHAYSETW